MYRLRKRVDRKYRVIVARFVYNKDKEKILRTAQTLLNEKPQRVGTGSDNEEFGEVGRRGSIVVDKLYVDKQRYIP